MRAATTTEEQRREYVEQMMKSPRGELRALFAAFAPQEIPAWFTDGGAAPYPDLPENPFPSGTSIHEEVRQWRQDGCWDLGNNDKATGEENQRAAKFQKDHWDAQQRRAQIMEANQIRRYFAWRWYYADRMLECAGDTASL